MPRRVRDASSDDDDDDDDDAAAAAAAAAAAVGVAVGNAATTTSAGVATRGSRPPMRKVPTFVLTRMTNDAIIYISVDEASSKTRPLPLERWRRRGR